MTIEKITKARADELLECGDSRELRSLAETLLTRNLALYWPASVAAMRLGDEFAQGLFKRALAIQDNWTAPRIETFGSAVQDEVAHAARKRWMVFLVQCLRRERRPKVASWIVWSLGGISQPVGKQDLHIADPYVKELVAALRRIDAPHFRSEVVRAAQYMTGTDFIVSLERFLATMPGAERPKFRGLHRILEARKKDASSFVQTRR